MSNLGKLSDKIRDLLARQVKQRGIVVWYDPEKAYTRLAVLALRRLVAKR